MPEASFRFGTRTSISGSRCWPTRTTWPFTLRTCFISFCPSTTPSSFTFSCTRSWAGWGSIFFREGWGLRLWRHLAGLGLLYLFESKQPLKAMGRVLRVGIAGGMFALTLAAVQAVPTLELIPRSGRAGGFDFDRVSAWSMHLLEFLNILIPNLFGDPFSLNLASYWGERVHGGREAY